MASKDTKSGDAYIIILTFSLYVTCPCSKGNEKTDLDNNDTPLTSIFLIISKIKVCIYFERESNTKKCASSFGSRLSASESLTMSSPRPTSLNFFARGDKSPISSPSSPVTNGPKCPNPSLRKTIKASDITYMSIPPQKFETINSPPARKTSIHDTLCPVDPRDNSEAVEVSVRASSVSPGFSPRNEVPEGYEVRKCFVNVYNGEVWFPAWDSCGQEYYYQVGKKYCQSMSTLPLNSVGRRRGSLGITRCEEVSGKAKNQKQPFDTSYS